MRSIFLEGISAYRSVNRVVLYFNDVFNPSLLEYSTRYESTQIFSPTFVAYHQSLAQRLIEQYDIHGKQIIEIGCGQGEFLTLLCNLGNNDGVGFDPVYNDDISQKADSRIKFIKDFYSENYSYLSVDFICCKMTLEHIAEVENFVKMIRRSIGNKLDTIIFFQVPDVTRILRELAFWDIYYEHCSYFSSISLSRLFRRCGFEIIMLEREYSDQYLVLTARPNMGQMGDKNHDRDHDLLASDVAYFQANYRSQIEKFQEDLLDEIISDQKVVIWGASSKGVAFLTALEASETIEFVVDINPNKHGTFMAGSGKKIVSPDFLREYMPDTVIVMNPIYSNEIKNLLTSINVSAKIKPV